jgi:hypothetical protein
VRPFTKKQGGLHIRELDIDETNGPVCCEVEGCQRMALQRVTMAGYPAAFLCSKDARLWVKLWAEFTVEAEAPVELARAA